MKKLLPGCRWLHVGAITLAQTRLMTNSILCKNGRWLMSHFCVNEALKPFNFAPAKSEISWEWIWYSSKDSIQRNLGWFLNEVRFGNQTLSDPTSLRNQPRFLFILSFELFQICSQLIPPLFLAEFPTVDATTVFGAAVVVIFVFLVFLLYLNKKWCFFDFKNFPFFCCDETILKSNRMKTFEGTIFTQQNINGQNLISLAEKGKVGTGSCPSSNCSTTSGEDEILKDKALRHRDSRGSGGSNKSRKFAKEVSVDTLNEDIIVPYCQSEAIPLDEPHTIEVEEIVSPTSQEDIFDVTDLQADFEDHEMNSIPTCGSLEVAFAYDAPMRKMTIHMLQARNIPSRDRGGATHTQVRLLMLPSKKQKHKSKIRSGENPQFMESFLLHRINPEDVNSMGVRFRLYGCERMRRERMIGECIVSFASLNLELETNLWLTLEPRANITLNSSTSDLRSLARSDSTSSTHSMQHGGVSELLLGLAYNGTTGRLSVEVVKGSHFSLCGAYKNLTMPRVSDTYVKLCLVSSTGREITRCKTSVRRGQPNPLFKELFMFQVALFQIPDVTLMVSVYMKRGMKRKEMVGWFSLGLNSSGEEELAHWNDMRDAKGEQICRWHVLIDS